MATILSNLNRLNFFSLEFLRKVIAKWILKIQPQLARVATLPCDTLMSAKKPLTTNYKVVSALTNFVVLVMCYTTKLLKTGDNTDDEILRA